MLPLVVRDFTDGEDLYNYSMGCVAQRWPDARVVYRYTNRDPAHRFRPGFAGELEAQLEGLAALRFDEAAFAFFRDTMPWLPLPYLQWLGRFRLDPAQVRVRQEDGRLDLTVSGRWYEAIYWEIKLLSVISELSGRDPATGELPPLAEGWKETIHRKARRLSEAGVQWIDFGTRRRYSFDVQDTLVSIMKEYPGFRGTSNPFLARRHGVKAIGTYAHQLPMAMQALYGPRSADRMAMQHWAETYRGELGIALSDTLTTGTFLSAFDSFYARLFTGVRQDSGDPIAFGERMIRHYEALGIDPGSKVIVFSDGLDVESAIRIHAHFAGRIRTTMGIGTHLTADPAMTGVPPLNHVIKLATADFGNGPVDVVKLSDEAGKASGEPRMVEAVRRLLDV
ncbi:MAG TPA: nicotinate phosphoribosyltransferase [Longimicrobiales bacterium]|nr:nicotinate phosphoribosyltransferase [Longimicrobiales bacterium]